MKRHLPLYPVVLIISLMGVGSLAAGCSGPKVETKSAPDLSRYHIRSIALIPFASIATPQARDRDVQGEFFFSTPSSIRRSDISISVPSTAEPPPKQTIVVPGYAAEKVTELFWGRLRDRKDIQVVSPGESAKAALAENELTGASSEKAAAMVVKKLNVDAALIGLVLVYQERVGSRLGASPPATVGFQVKVIAADGRVLWAGEYYERQRPMTEDLVGFWGRWAFVTAAELAEYGVDKILKEFPFGSREER